MYQHILVAVDGSHQSDMALRHALHLAAKLSATLRIVHIVDTGWLAAGPELGIDTGHLTAARREAGEDVLAAAQSVAQAQGVVAEAMLLETEMPTQRIAEAIAQAAADWPADLVVLGSHGYRGIQRLLLGSVAAGVARICSVPVLFVR